MLFRSENALATLLPIRRITAATIAGRITSPIIKSLLYLSFLHINIYAIPIISPSNTAVPIPNIDVPILIVLSVVAVKIDSNIQIHPFFLNFP